MKFVRRHRGPVAAAAAIVLVLAGGLAASFYQARLAESRLQQVRSLADALVFDVHDAVRDLPGATQARALIVKTGVEYLNSLLDAARGDTRAETRLATAYRKLGDAQGGIESSNLGATSEALVSYQQAGALIDEALRRAPADLEAVTERLIVANRMGALQGYTGKVRDAVATFQNAIRTAAPFEASGNTALRAALGDIYIVSSETQRNLEDYPAALHDSLEALRIFTGLSTVSPTDPSMRSSLAASYGAVGMTEVGLLRLPEALGHFQRGVAEMEQLVAADPRNAALKQALMLAYGHVADVLGNPGVGNLGNRTASLQAFQRASSLAKELYEADRVNQRAVADYGIALSRVETLMDEGPDKIRVQQESMAILGEAVTIDASNTQLKIYETLVAQHLGDSLIAAGDERRARDAYARAVQVAEPALPSGQASLLILFTQTAQRLARMEGAAGRRSEALDLGRRAVKAGESGATRTKARAYAALGFAYAALEEHAGRQPGDRDQALLWLHKSLDAWLAGKLEPGFAPSHQREMDQVVQAVARLERQ
jgi:non-specific serine/threonine protein kinase/serine/threonine-protein kinase